MERNWLNRTKYIAVRVNESAFERLQAVADARPETSGRMVPRCVIAVAAGSSPPLFDSVSWPKSRQPKPSSLTCSAQWGKDGKVSTQKAQEIVDKAHDEKYQEALDLLTMAHTKGKRFRWTMPPTISNQEERDE